MRLIDVDALPDDAGWCGDALIEAINNAPTIDLEPKWTPCSEGLPKKYGEYLCCDIRGEYILGMPFENEDSDTGFVVETDNEYMINCIAWMPLPEPWKGEENDS